MCPGRLAPAHDLRHYRRGQGIGAATARMAAARGASVMVADSTTAGCARSRRSPPPVGAAYQHCDVTDAEQVQALMRTAAEAFGGIDVLHNNAGIHETMLACPAVDRGHAAGRRGTGSIAVNLRGPWLCAKFAVPVPEAEPARAVHHQCRIHRSLGRRRVEPGVRPSKGGDRPAHQEPRGRAGPLRHPGQLLLPERDRDPDGLGLPGRGRGRPGGPRARAQPYPARRAHRPAGRHRRPGLLPGQQPSGRTSTARSGSSTAARWPGAAPSTPSASDHPRQPITIPGS